MEMSDPFGCGQKALAHEPLDLVDRDVSKTLCVPTHDLLLWFIHVDV